MTGRRAASPAIAVGAAASTPAPVAAVRVGNPVPALPIPPTAAAGPVSAVLVGTRAPALTDAPTAADAAGASTVAAAGSEAASTSAFAAADGSAAPAPALPNGTVSPTTATAAGAFPVAPVGPAAASASGVASPAVDAGGTAQAPVKQHRPVVLPELARIGADNSCSEVICNMRSAGPMLLTSPVVFPAFERVSVVLSTSAHPSKIVILDYADPVRSVGDRVGFANALVARMRPNDGPRSPAARTPSRHRVQTGLRHPPAAAGGEAGKGLAFESPFASELSDSDMSSGGDSAETGRERGGDGAVDGEDAVAGGGTQGADRFSAVQVANFKALLLSSSLSESLLNRGPIEAGPLRKKETVTSSMLERFLRCSGLPDLDALSFSHCCDLWKLAADMRNDMVPASGVARDWRSLCPTSLFENNWAFSWETPQTSPVAGRTCLFPLRHPRVRCSIESRRVALVVATALSPFWNLAIRRFSEANPYKPPAQHHKTSKEPNTPDGGPPMAPPSPPVDGAPPLPPTAPAADRGAGVHLPRDGSDDDMVGQDAGAGRERGSVSPLLADKGHAAQPPGAALVSAKDVLNLCRRVNAPAGPDGAAAEPPRKRLKLDEGKEPLPRPLECTSLYSLVARPFLVSKVTSAPARLPVAPPAPPTPLRGNCVALPSFKFVLRRLVAAGRAATVANLMDRWVAIPVTRPDGGASVRVAGAREFATVVKQQDKVSLLLPRDVLVEAGEKRHALDTAGKSVEARRAMDRAIVEVVFKEATVRFPFSAVPLMVELHGINADCVTAGQSSLWLEHLGNEVDGDHLIDPESNTFLMPSRKSVVEMKAEIKAAVGGATLRAVVWQRSVPTVADPCTG